MRQLAIIGSERSSDGIVPGTEGSFTLEGVPVRIGIIETEAPKFDPDLPQNADLVQFRVRAFSCNYRDRGLILRTALSERRRGYYVVGSDFVGEVMAVGRNVTGLQPGDRVIPDNAYGAPLTSADPQPGIPTNHGSKEIQAMHHKKLIRVPEQMSDVIAGSLSIGAQTAYSMVRRLDLAAGERVLVTGAKSNTALFVIAALRNKGVEVVGLSTSTRHKSRLKSLGLSDLIVVDPSEANWFQGKGIRGHLLNHGGFNAVIDPFSDVYLPGLYALMEFGSRYISCGVADQHSGLVGKKPFGNSVQLGTFMAHLVTQNITLIGNCLGVRQDLLTAVEDAASGKYPVDQFIDTPTSDPHRFFENTYADRGNFGKSTFCYGPETFKDSAIESRREIVTAD